MNEHFVAISIRRPRCLTWSVDDADFCHRCGTALRPQPEERLIRRSKQLLEESRQILERLVAANKLELHGLEFKLPPYHLEVKCSHCLRWRDYRKMKQTKTGGWLCFDHVECQDPREEHGIVESLMDMGFDRDVAEAWMEMPIRVFDGLTPRQMLQDGHQDVVEALVAKTQVRVDALRGGK